MKRNKETTYQRRPNQTLRQFGMWLVQDKTRKNRREMVHFKTRAFGYKYRYRDVNMVEFAKITYKEVLEWMEAFRNPRFRSLTPKA